MCRRREAVGLAGAPDGATSFTVRPSAIADGRTLVITNANLSQADMARDRIYLPKDADHDEDHLAPGDARELPPGPSPTEAEAKTATSEAREIFVDVAEGPVAPCELVDRDEANDHARSKKHGDQVPSAEIERRSGP